MRLIDADTLKEFLNNAGVCAYCDNSEQCSIHEYECSLPNRCSDAFEEIVDKQPTIEEHKLGRWVRDRYCSNCDWSNEDVYFTPNWTGNYCPNCGTKMKWMSVDISIKGE